MRRKAFIIHLARATGRRSYVDRLMADCGMPAEIVDAVDGGLLSAGQIAEVYNHHLHEPHYPFSLRPAEIGCFLSHRKCWQKIVDENLDYGFVLEDDAILAVSDAVPAMEIAEQYIADAGYIQFPVRRPPANAKIIASHKNISLLQPAVTPLRLSGQLVSKKAAEHLLAMTVVFDRPVDTFLQMHWITHIRPLMISPSGLSDCTQDAGGSTISRDKTLVNRVCREFQRLIYRKKIARLSALHAS
ncbi:MAG: glycosyltransferase family 25 protein [Rhizobiaceae bacterium]|nr:glycosyltransferase family 25 protein [Rhizobiaceae bacterium]